MREEKQCVRTFYDEFGWKKVDGKAYADTVVHVDRRSVMEPYYQRCTERMLRAVPPRGKLFLEIGCGASPRAELSRDYERHVCVDFSRSALEETRSKLGTRGLYVLADASHLPFRDGVFDAFAAIHMLYHVPGDEQADVVRQLHRVLAEGRRGLILYGAPDQPLLRVAILAERIKRKLRKILANDSNPTLPAATLRSNAPPLYFFAHSYTWFQQAFPSAWLESLHPWRTTTRRISEALVPDNLLGRLILNLFSFAEERFPEFMLRLGAYPLVVIRKQKIILKRTNS